MEKRGISRIIVILLLIIFVLIGIIIIWNIVKIFIERESEIGKIKTELLTERMNIIGVQFNPNNPSLINVSIRKTKEKSVLNTTQTTVISQSEIDIMSVADLSNSMSGQKLEDTKTANKELVSFLLDSENENRIGLVGYSRVVREDMSYDLTEDTAQLNAKIDSWTTKSGTCICCGINNATERLMQQSSAEKAKIMIVMSDGSAGVRCSQQNTGNASQDAIKSACDANATLQNLIIYSIGFDIQGNTLAEDTMTKIAQCGNGQYFSADIGTIINTYNDIAREIIKTSFISIQTFNYIKMVFYNETSSHEEIITDIPKDIFETKKYNFDLQGKIDNIQSVEIYPIALTKSGKEIIGPILDRWEQK